MSDLSVTFDVPGGQITMPLAQALRVGEAIAELRAAGAEPVWHANRCGCCVSVHGLDGGGWVIGEDGGADWHPPGQGQAP